MEDMKQLIKDNFVESIAVKQQALEYLTDKLNTTIYSVQNAFNNGNKILICGNGGSAADSQHFAAEFVGRFEIERLSLPAIALTTDTSALTAIGNDYGYDSVFSKQVDALGNHGDILFAISTSGNSKSIINAALKAKAKGMKVITMTGRDGGELDKLLDDSDIALNVRYHRTARIQEIHALMVHIICAGIDKFY
jgi:D-sedoheptulose 7-phosphate isomerase